MLKEFKEDFSIENLDISYLGIFSKKLRVLIIGGGRGATIKAKGLVKKGAYVEILANEVCDELKTLDVVILNESYNKKLIQDKHLIILVVNNEEIKKIVKNDCDENYKIYIDSSNYKEGIGILPIQRETKAINIAINTKLGNPKGASFAINKAMETLKPFDDFLELTGKIRNNLKTLEINLEKKRLILDFINSEDFKFIMDKNKDNIVLQMYLDENTVKLLYK